MGVGNTLQLATTYITTDNSYINYYADNTISGNMTFNGTGSMMLVPHTDGASLTVNGAITSAISIGLQSNNATSISGFVNFGGSNSGITNDIWIGEKMVLYAKSATALGTAAGPTRVYSGGALVFDLPSSATVAEPLNITGPGVEGVALIFLGANDVTLSGNILLTGDAAFSLTDTGAAIFTGVIRGAHNLTYYGGSSTPGNMILVQNTNTYTGSTTIEDGYVVATVNTAVPSAQVYVNAGLTEDTVMMYNSSDTAPDNQHVTLTNSATKKAGLVVYTKETIEGISGNGYISLTSTLELNSAANYTFGG